MLQVSPEPWNLWVLRCLNLPLLRGYWADSQKSPCGEATWCFHYYNSSVLLPSSSLASEFSSLKCTRVTKYWMTRSWEICHHVFCLLIPRSVRSVGVSSVPLLFLSRTQERPMTARKSSSIIRNCLWIVFTSFFVSCDSPFNVAVHWHEDDPVCEVLKFTL